MAVVCMGVQWSGRVHLGLPHTLGGGVLRGERAGEGVGEEREGGGDDGGEGHPRLRHEGVEHAVPQVGEEGKGDDVLRGACVCVWVVWGRVGSGEGGA